MNHAHDHRCQTARRVRVGDEGQRFEVRGVRHDGTVQVIGWTSLESGGDLAIAMLKNPGFKLVEVIDRRSRSGS